MLGSQIRTKRMTLEHARLGLETQESKRKLSNLASGSRAANLNYKQTPARATTQRKRMGLIRTKPDSTLPKIRSD